ncbi:hypothetical protein [Cellulomonas sp. URHE0023]|uniref:hypothetical protein n=1 Tax=Cellulomonas sp. URHE0023 TaxID=1380354 RepID=UPI000482BE24|nr:hypothetical protein [Cellulomonas sp. URHE0023]
MQPPDILGFRERLATLTPSAPRNAKNARVKVPQVDVELDGVKADPRKIALHPGPLDYVVSRDGETLHAFSSFEPYSEFLLDLVSDFPEELAAAKRAPAVNPAASSGGAFGYMNLYADPNLRGSRWRFDTQWGAIPDFRRVFPVLWWYTNINDQVTSVDLSELSSINNPSAFCVLCSDINMGGSRLSCWSLHVEADSPWPGSYPDLRRYGWDDIASSMFYIGWAT